MKERNRWTFSCFRVGNGSKNFGAELWWNSSRVGFGGNFWTWELMVMREWR